MRFYVIFAGLGLYLMAYTEAGDFKACRGEPIVQQVCHLDKNSGHKRFPWCKDRLISEMWYFDMRQNTCNKMIYLGCGGNSNRYCNRVDCESKCKKLIPQKDINEYLDNKNIEGN